MNISPRAEPLLFVSSVACLGVTGSAQDGVTPLPPAKRARPLYEWPTWPRFAGAGTADNAAGFTCMES